MLREKWNSLSRRQRLASESIIATLFFIVFSLWSNGWLLREDFWGIDDATFLRFARAANEARATGTFWQTLLSSSENTIGPFPIIFTYLQHWAFGEGALWPWQLCKLFQQTAYLCFLYGAARALGSGWYGVAMTLLLGFGTSAGTAFPDMQSFPANWWRLHTTDSYGSAPLACFWFLAALGVRRLKHHGWSRSSLAIIAGMMTCLFLVLMTKMSYIYLMPAIAIGLLTGLVCGGLRRPGTRRAAMMAGCALIVCLVSFPVYRIGFSGVKVSRYESQKIGDPTATMRALGVYTDALGETVSWLGAVSLLALFPMALLMVRRGRSIPEPTLWRRVVVVTALAAGLGGLLLQSLWPLILARYMIVFVPSLAIAIGFLFGRTILHFKARRQKPSPAVVIVCAAMTLGSLLALYWPSSRGLLKVAAFSFVPAAFLLATILLRLRIQTGLSRAVATALLSSTFVIQVAWACGSYREARLAFQVFYRGQNDIKVMLRNEVPAKVPFALATGYTAGEFISNTLWFLNRLEGRQLNITPLDKAATAPTGGVHSYQIPHPASESVYVPAVGRHGKFTTFGSQGGDPAGSETLAGDSPIVLVEFPAPKSTEITRMIVRMLPLSVPPGSSVRFDIVNVATGNVVGTACQRSVDWTRHPTNRVPVEVDPPAPLEKGTAYRVTARIERNEVPPFAFLMGMNDPVTFLKFRQGTAPPRIGLELQECEPIKASSPIRTLVIEKEVSLLHIDSPYSIMRFCIRGRGWGYQPTAIRPIRYWSKNTLLAWGLQGAADGENHGVHPAISVNVR